MIEALRLEQANTESIVVLINIGKCYSLALLNDLNIFIIRDNKKTTKIYC
jgi:hypothetical protein